MTQVQPLLFLTILNCTFTLSVTDSIKNFYNASCEGAVTSGSWGFCDMGTPVNKIKYESGDVIGNCIFIKEINPYIQPDGQTKRMAAFLCECGNEFEAMISNVKRGQTSSCGCYGRARLLESITSHKLSKHPLYRTWGSMINRCYNEKDEKNYKYYGGRGVVVCDEWRNDFKAFYDHVITLDHYGEIGYTLDRKKNNKGYEPGNVRWADAHTQKANQRVRYDNPTGYTGVTLRPSGWSVKITVKGSVNYLGVHGTVKEAVNARNRFIIDNNLTEYKIQEYVSVS